MQLLQQCGEFISNYRGPNTYAITVTDSDLHNPERAAIEKLCDSYLTNKGTGFDDNLYFFYKNHAHKHDYILSISDDDLFITAFGNPIHYLDIPIHANNAVTFFNHRSFSRQASGSISMGEKYYEIPSWPQNRYEAKRNLLALLPRHIGLLYASSFIQDNIETIQKFRSTLHLYAAVTTLAKPHEIAFIDLPLFGFCNDPPSGGAWESHVDVFHGLIRYLQTSKNLLPHHEFETMRDGFFQSYFSQAAWLRVLLEKREDNLPSELEIYELMCEPPPLQVQRSGLVKSVLGLFR